MRTYDELEYLLLLRIHGQRSDKISVSTINKEVEKLYKDGIINRMQYTRLWHLMKDIQYEEGVGAK